MAALSDAQLWTLCQQYWGTGQNALIAFCVALAESGGDPSRTHPGNADGSTDYGLFQINGKAHPDLLAAGNWSDPTSNANMAYRVYSNAGNRWTPWSAFNNGSYARFMSRAQAAEKSGGAPVPSDSASTPAATDSNGSGAADPLSTATSGSTWLRIGEFLAGGLLLFIVAISLVKNTSVFKAAKHVAIGAALA